MNYFEIEEKYMNWISKHKFLWLCLIVFTGILLGTFGGYLLTGSILSRQTFIMTSVYTSILIFVDLSVWGWN
jgi:hypothetical protein